MRDYTLTQKYHDLYLFFYLPFFLFLLTFIPFISFSTFIDKKKPWDIRMALIPCNAKSSLRNMWNRINEHTLTCMKRIIKRGRSWKKNCRAYAIIYYCYPLEKKWLNVNCCFFLSSFNHFFSISSCSWLLKVRVLLILFNKDVLRRRVTSIWASSNLMWELCEFLFCWICNDWEICLWKESIQMFGLLSSHLTTEALTLELADSNTYSSIPQIPLYSATTTTNFFKKIIGLKL